MKQIKFELDTQIWNRVDLYIKPEIFPELKHQVREKTWSKLSRQMEQGITIPICDQLINL